MRKQMPDFDVFNLERDVKGIFSDVFNGYLKGDLSYLEKTCEEVGLAYFKAMLKKREIDVINHEFEFYLTSFRVSILNIQTYGVLSKQSLSVQKCLREICHHLLSQSKSKRFTAMSPKRLAKSSTEKMIDLSKINTTSCYHLLKILISQLSVTDGSSLKSIN